MSTAPAPPEIVADLQDCCAPAVGGALDPAQAARLSAVFKALGDPTRLRLLSLVAAGGRGEACICNLTGPVRLSQPTVSHHMRLLVEAGLLTRTQRGRWAYYAIVPEAFAELGAALAAAVGSA